MVRLACTLTDATEFEGLGQDRERAHGVPGPGSGSPLQRALLLPSLMEPNTKL